MMDKNKEEFWKVLKTHIQKSEIYIPINAV